MPMSKHHNPQLETALRELTKLIKAVQYYPSGHPAMKSAAKDARQAFAPLFEDEASLSCAVHKDGFFVAEKKVGPQNQILQKLAAYLFARRVQNLTLLSDLSLTDLNAFARTLAVDPAEIRRQGGVKEMLQRARVTTIWVNETDLSHIFEEKQRIEDALEAQQLAGGADESTFSPEQLENTPPSLQEILQQLKQEKDPNRYRALLFELLGLIRSSLNDDARREIIEAYSLLCRHSSDPNLTKQLREAAHQSLQQLSDPSLLDFLVDTLCLKQLSDNGRDLLMRILIFLRSKSIDHLMNRLTKEDNAHNRRILVEAMVRQGEEALPVISAYLQDDRWFVIRNAVSIIGDIRSAAGAAYLNPLLHHNDIRVCREAIRSLTRIGGADAAKILLQAVEDQDQEISRQALLSLGVVKDSSAVPVLLKIIQRGDFFMKRSNKVKDALNALGEIGSAEAVPALIVLVNKRRLFKRAEFNALRALAAQALGDIGHPDALPALEAVYKTASGELARQASSAMRQIARRQEQHGS